MVVAWTLAAEAKPPVDVAEEVVVYDDDFARWDHTRWLLRNELVLPLGLVLGAEENVDFLSFGFQVRAVVACEKDARLGKNRWEVLCTVEDFGLLASTENRWRTDADRAAVERVLAEIDARVTGAKVQLQVDDEGGIGDFDLEGLDADNLRERRMAEATRQLLMRVMAGFHLRIPAHAQRVGQWVEYNSELWDLPSLNGARGSGQLLHQVSPYAGPAGEALRLVQTVGKAAVVVQMPNNTRDPFVPTGDGGAGVSGGQRAGSGIAPVAAAPPPTAAAPMPSRYQSPESALEASFAIEVTGVALFDPASGVMTERVWTCAGAPTAGSARNVGRYMNFGRIQLLGADEHPDVGPTTQVAWPRPADGMAGLPAWPRLEDE